MGATVRPVNNPRSEGPSDGSPATLGSVLYADAAQPLVTEGEWVELIRDIKKRREPALKELYERTHRVVFTLIVRIVRDPLTAEEVTLDVYHDVWRKAATFDATRGTVIAWLMNQTRSRAVDRLRSETRKKRTQSAAPIAADIMNAAAELGLFQ